LFFFFFFLFIFITPVVFFTFLIFLFKPLPQVVEQDILFLQKIHRQKNSFNTPGLPLL
jgi:hypothetical protein